MRLGIPIITEIAPLTLLTGSAPVVTRKVTNNLQVQDIYNFNVRQFMYKYTNFDFYRLHLTIILNSLQMFIRIVRDKLKLGNLVYQKDVQTQA